VRELARRYRVLLDRLSRAEEMADGMTRDLEEIEGELEASSANRPLKSRPRSAAPGLSAGEALERTAEGGVAAIDVTPRPDGSFKVRIDDGKAFALPPALGDLLSILMIDGGQSEDELIGWKTVEDVAILLSKRLGRPVRRHATTQHIYRLRRELFARGGVNPFLVQTNRRLGVRFALRRPPAPMIGSDLS
jgi:hypothetical protein